MSMEYEPGLYLDLSSSCAVEGRTEGRLVYTMYRDGESPHPRLTSALIWYYTRVILLRHCTG